MSDFDFKGLEEDISALQNLAPKALDVLEIIKKLGKEISDGVNNYQLQNGSHIKSRHLEGLDPDQIQRVFDDFVGRLFENKKTHHQYQIVLDESIGELAVISSDDSHTGFCLHDPGYGVNSHTIE